MWFNRKSTNRRLHRSHVLDVKLRTDLVRRQRARLVMQGFVILFGAAFVMFLAWRGVDVLVRKFVTENQSFALHELDVRTDGVLSVSALRQWVRVQPGDNLMQIDLARIKRDLELCSMIHSVAVERVLPRTLRVRVTEREPVAQVLVLWPAERGGYTRGPYLLDASGQVMGPPQRTMVADPRVVEFDWLPELKGINESELRLGRVVESAQVRAALRFLAQFESSPMYGRAEIRRVEVGVPEILTVITEQGAEVVFSAQRDFEAQFRRWRHVYDLGVQHGRAVAAIDVSITQNLPVRWADAGTLPPAKPKPAKPVPYRRKNV